jgi:hypothetical protein
LRQHTDTGASVVPIPELTDLAIPGKQHYRQLISAKNLHSAESSHLQTVRADEKIKGQVIST